MVSPSQNSQETIPYSYRVLTNKHLFTPEKRHIMRNWEGASQTATDKQPVVMHLYFQFFASPPHADENGVSLPWQALESTKESLECLNYGVIP